MVTGKLGVAVAEDLVDRARDLAPLDMGRADVVGGRDERGRERLHPVAVNDDEVGAMLGHIVGEAGDGLGEDDVLRVTGPLVQELVHAHARQAMHLVLGQPVAVEHVHARDEEADLEACIPRGDCQGLELAEIGARAGDKKKGSVHVAPSRTAAPHHRKWGRYRQSAKVDNPPLPA